MKARRPGSVLALFVGVLVLWALFLPGADPGGHRLIFDPRPQALILALLAALALFSLARGRLPGWLRWLLAALLLVVAILQLADAALEQQLDRPLDLYFDSGYLPSMLGLFLAHAGFWRGAAAALGIVLLVLALLGLIAWALGAVARGLRRRGLAAIVLAAALGGFALMLVPIGDPQDEETLLGRNADQVIADQAASGWHEAAVMHGWDKSYAARLAVPQPVAGPLPGLAGRDVYLVYFESFGTIVLDDPRLHAELAPALGDFAAQVTGAGYRLLSSRLVSPTFGGGSYLAHGTMASGIKLDSLSARLVLTGKRLSLPRYMAAAGYRTVDIEPAISKPMPENVFWGFDKDYYAADLGYDGPAFGFYRIPDQYTLRHFDETELTPGHQPLFAQFVLVSSHTPFAPVPPYLPDWRDAGRFESIGAAAWDRIDATPDWTRIETLYAQSVAYDLKTLAGWLAGLKEPALIIILGDHQPPGFYEAGTEPWTVPIYVLSRDAGLVQPFADRDYGAGAEPPRSGPAPGMESFLDGFLADFSRK